MPRSRPWTPQEERYLQEHYEDMSIYDIAKALRRSLNAIRTRRTMLGLTNRQRPWSEGDMAYFRENQELPDAELAAQLQRSVDEVAAMRTRTKTGRKHPGGPLRKRRTFKKTGGERLPPPSRNGWAERLRPFRFAPAGSD